MNAHSIPILLAGFLVGVALGWGEGISMMRHASATTIYVAPTGDDANPGMSAKPLRTLQKAVESARPGDTIHVRAGIYTERVQMKTSGTPGQPIVLEGERGPNGEYLTILDASVPIRVRWVPAPEIGPGVFKAPYPGFEPYAMLVGGKCIPRIWNDHMADGEGFKKLAYPPDQTETTMYGKREVKFWDLVGAMFGFREGTVYLRFRDGDDPNQKELRAAPAGGGIEIRNQSHWVVRHLMVRGGHNCIRISGPKATHNVVEHCRLVNATERIQISEGASENLVRHNEITTDFYAEKCITGAWGGPWTGPDVPYEIALKEYFYNLYKYFFGPNSTSDYGVRMNGVGPGNEVCYNHVFRGGQGIHVSDATDTKIHNNRVHEFSSIGIISTMNRVVNVQVYDNFVSDCNINLRIHHVNEPGQKAPRSLYVYRNRFALPPHVGTHIFFHYWEKNDVADYLHPHLFIYHNSFSGGRAGLSPSGYAVGCGGLPNTLVVNNVFSTDNPVQTSLALLQAQGVWAAFDYNWLGGAGKPSRPGADPSWYGPSNIAEKGKQIWDPSTLPDFRLPPDSQARQAGLDLSRRFTVGGKTYDPLPGMEPGYFFGPKPDMGAVQHR